MTGLDAQTLISHQIIVCCALRMGAEETNDAKKITLCLQPNRGTEEKNTVSAIFATLTYYNSCVYLHT